MSDREKNRGMERFEHEFRRWGGRPPRTQPETAGRRIAARLGPAHTGLPLWRMAAAAAAMLLVVWGSWGLLRLGNGTPHGHGSPTAFSRSEAYVPPPLEENVVLWWLDDKTPVYFVLEPGDQG